MFEKTRILQLLAGGVAVAAAGVMGFAGTTASAEPVLPAQPAPAPVTVTQTVTVAPAAAGVSPTAQPAAAAVPDAAVATPMAASPLQPAVTAPVAPPQPVLSPAASGTLTDFFRDKGVTMEAQNPQTFRALNLTLPMPTGWSQVPDPNVPDAFAVIADRNGGDGLYTSNAQLVVYKLSGDFDPNEAITHGLIDSQQLPNWQSTDASLAYFNGFPSSVIEGTYRQNDMVLNTSRRHVIATSGTDRYLVSLSVTTAANQAVAAASATDAIVNGFRVVDPAARPAAPAPAAAPAAAPAPAATLAPAAAPALPAAAAPVS
ncbi:MAG: LpqN/LpqT family lipoprotein [Mycobacterium sp.]|nr:LpqN/LpqT family lipoprotein [Mycobacterium sp.]